jgi:hypothetical protein
MLFNLLRTKVFRVNTLFLGHYLDPKVFYTVKFNAVPSLVYMGELDTSKAFHFIRSTYRSQIKEIYQHNYFDHDKKEILFNNTLFVLTNRKMIELTNNYCQVLHSKDQYDWGQTVIRELSVFHATVDPNKTIGFTRTVGISNKE